VVENANKGWCRSAWDATQTLACTPAEKGLSHIVLTLVQRLAATGIRVPHLPTSSEAALHLSTRSRHGVFSGTSACRRRTSHTARFCSTPMMTFRLEVSSRQKATHVAIGVVWAIQQFLRACCAPAESRMHGAAFPDICQDSENLQIGVNLWLEVEPLIRRILRSRTPQRLRCLRGPHRAHRLRRFNDESNRSFARKTAKKSLERLVQQRNHSGARCLYISLVCVVPGEAAWQMENP